MTTPPDLPDFLLARIGEREATARATAEDYPPPWRGRELDDEGDSMESGIVFDAEHREVVYWEAGRREAADRLGAHVVRHDPARVLADCAAQRAIVGRWRSLQQRIEAETDDVRRERLALTRHGLDMFMYQFAAVYADHPDYRPSFRPAP